MALDDRIRIIGSFLSFGLINNLLYVVILSAAIDSVGVSTPKGLVLLADVLPSFLFKVSAPFYFHVVTYPFRLASMIIASFTGMQMIAHSASLMPKLFGIVLASLASGIGEVTFSQLTHYFDESAVHAWSSGTGAAGLVGSAAFMVMTTWSRVSTKTTLITFSFIPLCLGIIYVYCLPGSIQNDNHDNYNILRANDDNIAFETSRPAPEAPTSRSAKMELLRRFIVPFILPLMTVYIAEYVINQGISPTSLFDSLDMTMFHQYRDAYVAYGTLYQMGVFISRSSGAFVKINNLWSLAILQTINVVLALSQSLFMFNPSIYITFIFMLYEGLLGGAAYVNTFASVSNQVSLQNREFALGAVTMSDSSGVVLAAIISMWLEPRLCRYQVHNGRPWCEIG